MYVYGDGSGLVYKSGSIWEAWCLYWLRCLLQPGVTTIHSSRPGQNGRHFADDISRCIFVNEKFYILIKNLLKFVPKGPIDNSPALVEIMAWRQIGSKPLSEPMLTWFTDTYATPGGNGLITLLAPGWNIQIFPEDIL